MTIATGTNLIWRASTATEHYNWMKIISDALTAIGFLKTTDTGQINLAGPTFPLPSGMVSYSIYYESGYEIRRLESPGLPTIYCRIGYGVVRGSFQENALNNYPYMRMQFASGVDGAGNLQGVMSNSGNGTNQGYSSGSSVPPNGTRPFYFSSDGANYLTMLIDPMMIAPTDKGTNSPLNFVLERTINAETDAYDGDGWVQLDTQETTPSLNVPGSSRTNINAIAFRIFNIQSGSVWGSAVPVQAPLHIQSSGVAGVTPLFPVTVMVPQIKGPMGSAIYFFRNDIFGAVTFKSRIYGVDRQFITTGYHTGNSAIQPSYLGFAGRFE